MRDFAAAFRVLRRNPGFTAAAIATVALGTGASTAVFSTVNGVLIRSLPYPAGDRVVHVTQPTARNPNGNAGFSIPELQDYRTTSQTLSAIAEYHSMPFQIYGRGDPIRAQTGVVSAHFFEMLGVEPELGRLFREGEDAVGVPAVVLISHRFWVKHLGSDSSVVGATFTMNDRTHEIVGVLPPLPAYPNDNDIYMPAGACPFRSSPRMLTTRGARMVSAFAALRDGADLDGAQRELGALQARFKQDYREAYNPNNELSIVATPLKNELTARARPILWTLLATSLFLLIVAVANFANLTLARQLRRTEEFALRSALGGGSAQLLRQLVIESLAVTIPGSALGALIAYGSLGVLRTLAAQVTPRANEITVDLAVLGFALGLSLLVGLAAALGPFLRLRATTLATGALGGLMKGPTRTGLQDGLIAVQLGVAVVILAGAALLGKSVIRLQQVDARPAAYQAASARVDLNWSRYTQDGQVRQFTDAVLTGLNDLPGIRSAAIANSFPLNNANPFLLRLTVSRPEGTDPGESRGNLLAVSPNYFSIVGIALLTGRVFTQADRDTIAPPVIVSRAFAKSSWGDVDPIGQRVSPDSGRTWYDVIGLVDDVRQHDLTADPTPLVYVPFGSRPGSDFRVLATVSAGGMSGFTSQLRRIVGELDPQQPVGEFQTLGDVRDARLSQPRLTAVLLVGFAVVALALTATGIAGVVATSVGRRRKDIAVQKALGAPIPRVVRHLLRPIITMSAVGLVLGLGAATALGRLIEGLLYEVRPSDPLVLTTVTVGAVAVALGAALWPARAVLKVDPARVLRGE